QADKFKSFHNLFFQIGTSKVIKPSKKLHIFICCQILINSNFLWNQANFFFNVSAIFLMIFPKNRNFAICFLKQAGYHMDSSTFTRTVCSEKSEYLPLFHSE